MSRYIKFRAWDGKHIYLPDSNFFYITNSGDALRAIDSTAMPWMTLMQYTGLKDKNGAEIYEGDICKFLNPDSDDVEVSPIIFSRGQFTTNWSSQGLGRLFSIYHNDDGNGGVEVIGNIYENPELLKVS
jgi:uncharacterized phage protein (TIGR01671 family)